jgi:hypothetical protein
MPFFVVVVIICVHSYSLTAVHSYNTTIFPPGYGLELMHNSLPAVIQKKASLSVHLSCIVQHVPGASPQRCKNPSENVLQLDFVTPVLTAGEQMMKIDTQLAREVHETLECGKLRGTVSCFCYSSSDLLKD